MVRAFVGDSTMTSERPVPASPFALALTGARLAAAVVADFAAVFFAADFFAAEEGAVVPFEPAIRVVSDSRRCERVMQTRAYRQWMVIGSGPEP